MRIQIFLTISALPILVLWGLPISILTVPGNLIFAPLLSTFLFISSLIFFLELINMPNNVPIWCLEKLSNFWVKLVPPKHAAWMIYFPQNSWLCFAGGLILAIYLLTKVKQNHRQQTISLGGILLASCLIAKFPFWIDHFQIDIVHRKKRMHIQCHPNGTLTIHDYGILNLPGIEGWINYTLLSTVARKFGTIRLNQVYLERPNQLASKNLGLLREIFGEPIQPSN